MIKHLLGLVVMVMVVLPLFNLVIPAYGMSKAVPVSQTTEEVVNKAGVYSETGYYHIYVPVKSGDRYLLRYIKYDKSEVKAVDVKDFALLPGDILSNVFVTSKHVYVISRSETADTLYIYPRTSEPQSVQKESKAIDVSGRSYVILGIEYNGTDYIVVSGSTGFRIYSYNGDELVSKFYCNTKDLDTPVTIAYTKDGPIVVYQVLNADTSKHDLQYVKLKDLVTAKDESNITFYKLASLDHKVVGYLQVDTDTVVAALTPTINFISLPNSGTEKEIPIPEGDTLTSAPVMEKTIQPRYVFIGSEQGKIYGVPLNNYTILNSPPLQVSAHTEKIQYMGVINFEEATDFYVIALTSDGYIIVYRKDLISRSTPKVYMKKRITSNNGFKGLQVFDADNEAIITSKEQIFLLYREKGQEGNPGLRTIYKVGKPLISQPPGEADGGAVAPSGSILPLIITLVVVVVAIGGLYYFFRKQTTRKRPRAEEKREEKGEEEEIPEELEELKL